MKTYNEGAAAALSLISDVRQEMRIKKNINGKSHTIMIQCCLTESAS